MVRYLQVNNLLFILLYVTVLCVSSRFLIRHIKYSVNFKIKIKSNLFTTVILSVDINLSTFIYLRNRYVLRRLMTGPESVPANLLHVDTITCLRNSGAKYRERRDNAILARPGRTEARSGTGNEAADTIDAANKLTTRTEHLCRVRKAHRVSLRDSRRVSFIFRGKTGEGSCRQLRLHSTIFPTCDYRMSCGFPVLSLKPMLICKIYISLFNISLILKFLITC